MPTFNNRIKQVLTLAIIIILMCLVVSQLTAYIPGLLGAITLYIVSRRQYFRLVYQKKYKRGWVALGFIIFYLLLIGVPFTIAAMLISPKINDALKNPDALLATAQHVISTIQAKIGFKLLSDNSLNQLVKNLTSSIPKLLNSTLTLVANLGIMLFVLYYMLYNGSEMEKYLNRIIPLKRNNIQLLSFETKKLVISNALGIPLISLIQGITATIGYLIFGVQDWGLYGFLTGVAAFVPVVGTMIVWVPLVMYMYATGDTMNALWVGLYSLLITGNVDYVARITLLRRMGDVHPIITIMGVLVGLGLFGFVGLVFGPLLINYIIVLYDIYMNEFVYAEPANVPPETTQDEAQLLSDNAVKLEES